MKDEHSEELDGKPSETGEVIHFDRGTVHVWPIDGTLHCIVVMYSNGATGIFFRTLGVDATSGLSEWSS
jgi:hypothetical protein